MNLNFFLLFIFVQTDGLCFVKNKYYYYSWPQPRPRGSWPRPRPRGLWPRPRGVLALLTSLVRCENCSKTEKKIRGGRPGCLKFSAQGRHLRRAGGASPQKKRKKRKKKRERKKGNYE